MSSPAGIEMSRSRAGLWAVADGLVLGQAAAGQSLTLRVDGVVAAEGTLPQPADWAGLLPFALPLPPEMPAEGAEIEVRDGAGAVLGRMAFRPAVVLAAEARAEGPVITGTVTLPATSSGQALAAMVQGRPVAQTWLDPAEGRFLGSAVRIGFVLMIPAEVLRLGPQRVHLRLPQGDCLLPVPALRVTAPRGGGAGSAWRRLASATEPFGFALKIAAPTMGQAAEWGDFHFARAIKAALEARGFVARIDCVDEWDRREASDQVALVLRGRQRYRPDPTLVNLTWIISHPDRLETEELDGFDHVLVASSLHARSLRRATIRPVAVLHQATDPAVFRPPAEPIADLADQVVFIGNSRLEYRSMVRWAIQADLPLAVWGSRWEGIIPQHYLRGEYIANDELHRVYASAAIVLNDHWDTMRDAGFVSNRLFDVSAAGGFCLTDPVKGLAEIFADHIPVVEDGEALARAIRHWLADPAGRRAKAEAARRIVVEGHSFQHRVETILALPAVAVRLGQVR